MWHRPFVVSRLFVVNKLSVATRLVVESGTYMVSRLSVVSRLALRWAAQQPQYSHHIFPERLNRLAKGPLRAPTQGKPAHHKVFAHHKVLLTTKGLLTT